MTYMFVYKQDDQIIVRTLQVLDEIRVDGRHVLAPDDDLFGRPAKSVEPGWYNVDGKRVAPPDV